MNPTIAVVDRTGVLHDAVQSARLALSPPPDVHDVRRYTDFDLGGVRADVLLLGVKELSAAGRKRALRWATENPDGVVLAHLPPKGVPTPTATALREAGISAWFRGTPTDDRLVRLLLEALPDVEVPARPTSEPTPQHEPDAEREPATVVSVCSPTGGSGKSFFATSLATRAAEQGRGVLLVDLDLQFGQIDAALQVRHQYSVYDGLYDAAGRRLPDDVLGEHLVELVHCSTLGFDLLLAPRDPILADSITAEDIEHVLATVAQHYDVVVVDCPPLLTEIVLAALDASTVTAVLAVPDVPSLRSVTTFLEVLDELGIGADRRRLVLNKVEHDAGIDADQAVQVLGGGVVAQVPGSKAVVRALNRGTVVLRSEPKAAVCAPLVEAIDAVVPPLAQPGAPVAAPARTSRLRDLFRAVRTSPGGTS